MTDDISKIYPWDGKYLQVDILEQRFATVLKSVVSYADECTALISGAPDKIDSMEMNSYLVVGSQTEIGNYPLLNQFQLFSPL